MSDQMDLLVEQVKMLAGEIAFSTSTLKRMMEQSSNDPENSKTRTEVSFILSLWTESFIHMMVSNMMDVCMAAIAIYWVSL